MSHTDRVMFQLVAIAEQLDATRRALDTCVDTIYRERRALGEATAIPILQSDTGARGLIEDAMDAVVTEILGDRSAAITLVWEVINTGNSVTDCVTRALPTT